MFEKQRVIRNRVSGHVSIYPTWCEKTASPDPCASIEIMREQWERLKKSWERERKQLKDQGYGDFTDTTAFSVPAWPWYGMQFAIAVALGASEPEWDGMHNTFWMDKKHHALDYVKSVSDVRRIKIPNWSNLPQTEKMFKSRERWKIAFPGATTDCQNVGTGWEGFPSFEKLSFVAFPAFLDIGIFLLGGNRFCTILISEHELAQALMDKCFELSTSCTEFLMSHEDAKMEFLVGFGADACCLLSPTMYEKYGIRWDTRLLNYVKKKFSTGDDLMCNLHSCGPSAHLYDMWGQHPCRKNIKIMQTRLIPGKVRELRRNLPNTYLELTIQVPHFDFVSAEPEEVKTLVNESVRDCAFRDVYFNVPGVPVYRIEYLDRVRRNREMFYKTLDELTSKVQMTEFQPRKPV